MLFPQSIIRAVLYLEKTIWARRLARSARRIRCRCRPSRFGTNPSQSCCSHEFFRARFHHTTHEQREHWQYASIVRFPMAVDVVANMRGQGVYLGCRYEAIALVLLRQMGSWMSQWKPYLDFLPSHREHTSQWLQTEIDILRG